MFFFLTSVAKLTSMRRALITGMVLLAWGHASNAQKLNLTPQIGFEKNNTTVSFNGHTAYSPICNEVSPQLGLRMNYEFKKGHGPYLAFGTTRHIISMNVDQPENITRDLDATRHAVKFRSEAGYQLSTKSINLSGKSKSTASVKSPAMQSQKVCGSYSRYKCGNKPSESLSMQKKEVASHNYAKANKGWSMRIQPSAGAVFVPALREDVALSGEQTSFSYHAGNYDMGIVSRVGFEFAKNNAARFTVALQYLKGISNLNDRQVVTTSGTKSHTTNVGSSVSSWSLVAGIPINLYKKQQVQKKPVVMQKKEVKHYPSRCGQYKMQYRSL